MAGIDTGGHGGKKAINQELPLVPFIDFLLCCVMFLLVTAVWNQLARIHTNQSIAGQTTADESEPPIRRRLRISTTGYDILIGSDAPQTIAKNGEMYNNTELLQRLRSINESDPNRHDIIVESVDGVEYHHVIEAMDTVSQSGLVDFSLSPVPMGN